MPETSLKSQIARTHELIQLWTQFHDLYGKAALGGTIDPQDEKKFLDLKSQIARRYQGLVQLAGPKNLPDIRSMESIARITSLGKANAIDELEKEKIEADWNTTFVTLNRFLGGLEADKEQGGNVTALTRLRRTLFSPWLTLIYLIIVIVLGFVIWYEWFPTAQS